MSNQLPASWVQADLLIMRNTAFSENLRVYTRNPLVTNDATPVDSTGQTIVGEIAKEPEGAAVIDFTITTIDASISSYTFSLTKAQTKTLAAGRYVYVIRNSTTEKALAMGTVTIVPFYGKRIT